MILNEENLNHLIKLIGEIDMEKIKDVKFPYIIKNGNLKCFLEISLKNK